MRPPIGSARDYARRLAGAALGAALRLPGGVLVGIALAPTLARLAVRVAG